MSLVLFFAQHVSNVSTFIFRSLCVCVYTTLVRCVLALRCGSAGWCGILMQAEALLKMNVLAFETCYEKKNK